MRWLVREAVGSMERLTRRVLREITAPARCRALGRALRAATAALGVTAAAIIAATALVMATSERFSSDDVTSERAAALDDE